jgi:type VI secretion system protein ImpL
MWAKLKRFFSSRWVLSIIGLLIVAFLIWIAGDAIAIYDRRPLGSEAARLTLIAVIVLGYLCWEGFKAWRSWRTNKAILAGLGAGGESSNAALSQRELAELKSRFDRALTVLRTARFEDKSGRRSYLYQLPWYMFIGAPGSGKTTALENSGLRFPLSESVDAKGARTGPEIPGSGGTSNCDWLFTDEAVLLDTAGRYTTQSSNQEVDSSAWLGFLALLKRYRPRQPLTGVIVTVSMLDLLTQSTEQRAEYARLVRTRIQELYTSFGQRFPIYVLGTKCDLLSGFTEFFADMGREARTQVWGMTFPFVSTEKVEVTVGQFEREFDALVKRLTALSMARVQEVRDPQRRAVVFAFPQQFAVIKPLLKSFLDDVFQSSAFSEAPMFRGVYFSSGTQEGTPIDRVLGSISRTFGLQRQSHASSGVSGRSFFIARLLREVVFEERDLGGRNAAIERRRVRMARVGYAAFGVACALLLAGWTLSFVRNQVLVDEVEKSAAAVAKLTATMPKLPSGDVRVTLPVLEALSAMPAGPASQGTSVPLTQGLGLYQGDKLGSEISRVYQNLLRDTFLPRVVLRLEQQMRDAPALEDRYEALKAYEMLYVSKHLNAKDLEAWVAADWATNADLRSDLAALTKHLRAALRAPVEMVLPRNTALVDDTRRKLAGDSLAKRAYGRLKLAGVSGVPDFRLNEAAGPSGALVLGRRSNKPLTDGVPAFFTVKGYNKAFHGTAKALVARLAEEEVWVLGPQASGGGLAGIPSVLDELQRLYLGDYIRVWDELLNDLRLLPTSDLQSSIQAMTLLSAGDSPLRQLLQAAARETKLAAAPVTGAEQATAKLVDRAASSVREGIDKMLGEPRTSNQPAAMRPEAMVDKHFEQLHLKVLAPQGGQAQLDGVLSILKEYEVFLRANQEAAARGTLPLPDTMIKARIKSAADGMPPPVSGMLNGLVSSSGGQAAQVAKEGVEKQLSSQMALACKPAVDGRYPFSRGQQTKEIPLGDFNNLFRPGGILDGFAKTSLVGLVDTSAPVWRPLKIDGVAQINDASASNFQRAGVIRDAFFPGGSPSPTVQADLILTKLDEGVADVQFSNDGQTTRLTAGSGVRILWPSPRPLPQIKLNLTMNNKADGPSLSFEGAWAPFRLVDAARIDGGTSDRLLLTLMVGDRRLGFELRSGSVHNPLRLPELAQFRCPG